jgi:hypothetical protein
MKTIAAASSSSALAEDVKQVKRSCWKRIMNYLKVHVRKGAPGEEAMGLISWTHEMLR